MKGRVMAENLFKSLALLAEFDYGVVVFYLEVLVRRIGIHLVTNFSIQA